MQYPLWWCCKEWIEHEEVIINVNEGRADQHVILYMDLLQNKTKKTAVWNW